jgi:outer membrane lipoprotein SlyB
METEQKSRIHPLAAGAAVAVIIVSAVGVAAMTGHLPGSNAGPAAAPQVAVAPPPVAAMPSENAVPEPAAHDSARNQQVAAASQTSVAQTNPVCANCGVVEAVHAVKHKGKGGYVGMIGGGVAGALVGSQIGHGGGKTVAELAGAAGGAFLGNEVEKKVHTTTHYAVVVRLENGGTQTVSYATQPGFSVGSRVRVENGTLVQN